MKRSAICYLLLAISAFALVPLLASAHTPDIFPAGYWGGEPGTNLKGLISCSGPLFTLKANCVPSASNNYCRQDNPNACKGTGDLIHTFIHFVYFGMTIALFLLAPLFFAWGGLMILIAGDSPEKMSSGKKILTGTVIGVVIVLCAYLIVKLFVSALGISDIGGF